MQLSQKTKDPVCLMELDPNQAIESEDYQDHRYYFCNQNCHTAFQLDPERYAKRLLNQAGV